MVPLKLLPARERWVSLSSVEIAGETEPYRFKSVKSTDTTRPRRHWIPDHEQTELKLEVFQVFRSGCGNWNPSPSESRTWKSLSKDEPQTEENRVKTIQVKVKVKGTIVFLGWNRNVFVSRRLSLEVVEAKTTDFKRSVDMRFWVKV